MFDQQIFSALTKGEERSKYLKKCIDEADREKDYASALDLRYRYIRESVFNEDNFKSIIMFPEFMALYDAHPDDFDSVLFMTVFKWVIEDITDFYQISIEKAEEYFEEFRSRCIKYGFSLRTYYMKKIVFYTNIDAEKVSELSKLFRKSERDSLSDCHACEANADVEIELNFGSEEKAVAMLNDMLRRNISCGKVPETTYGACVNHFTRIGRLDEAEHYADMMLPMIKDEANFLMEMSHVLLLKSFTDPNKAYDIFCRNIEFFIKNRNPKMRFYFAAAAARFFDSIQDDERLSIGMLLPRTFALYNENNEYNITKMRDYFHEIAADLARKFDKRNGTSNFTDKLNYDYPAEPVKSLSLPKHGSADRAPMTIAVPFRSIESVPSPEEIINILKELPDIEIQGASADKEQSVISIIGNNTKLKNNFTYRFLIRDAEEFGHMQRVHYISDEAFGDLIENYRFMLIIITMYDRGCEGLQLNQLLKAANAVNTDNSPAIIDLTNRVLWSSEWSAIQSESAAPPPEKYMFSVHGCPSDADNGTFELYTSGLSQYASRELLASNIDENDMDFVFRVISQIARSICTAAPLRDEGEPSDFGVFLNNETSIKFAWFSESGESDDSDGSLSYAMPVIYLSPEDYDNGKGILIQEIPEEIRDDLVFRSSNRQNYNEEIRAKERFSIAMKHFSAYKDTCELIVGMDVDIPKEFQEDYGEKNYVYIKVQDSSGIIDSSGLNEIPQFREGEKIEIDPEKIFFWRLGHGDEYFFSDNAYML